MLAELGQGLRSVLVQAGEHLKRRVPEAAFRSFAAEAAVDPADRWVALTNTTMAVFMSSLDGSIVIIALPAIFRGTGLDPLAPANIAYLLWMIMGYRLVQALFVVNLGRLGE